MTETSSADKVEPTTIIEAQDAIAAGILEIERLARTFFVIARDLQAPEQEDGFDEQEPGPEHLRWFTAAGAMAAYEGLLDLVPYVRKAAECTDADLRHEWEELKKLDGRTLLVRELTQTAKESPF